MAELVKNQKDRDVIRLVLDGTIVLFVLSSSLWMALGKNGALTQNGWEMFKFFTVLSNLFVGLTSLLEIPFLVLCLKKKKEDVPFWTLLASYCSTVSIFITLCTVLFFLGPTNALHGGSYFSIFTGPNFFMHLLTPLLSLINFVFFHRSIKMSFQWTALPLVSVVLYGAYYLIQLKIHDSFGKADYDWYGFTASPIPWPAFLIIFLMASYFLSAFLFLVTGLKKKREIN